MHYSFILDMSDEAEIWL